MKGDTSNGKPERPAVSNVNWTMPLDTPPKQSTRPRLLPRRGFFRDRIITFISVSITLLVLANVFIWQRYSFPQLSHISQTQSHVEDRGVLIESEGVGLESSTSSRNSAALLGQIERLLEAGTNRGMLGPQQVLLVLSRFGRMFIRALCVHSSLCHKAHFIFFLNLGPA
jgi:hypothetical protein